MLLLNTSAKTGWFQLGIIVVMTIISFYFIKEAFAKTLIEWQNVNELQQTEIQGMLDQ
ncbi:MAG: hypothetical protein WC675_03970 [Patescibacteria group bacterium]|jgi:hypothetical protein